MKIKTYLFLLLLPLFNHSWGDDKKIPCDNIMSLTLETGERADFCELDNLMVSENCYKKKSDCKLIIDYKKNFNFIKSISPLQYSSKQNPGSKICNDLKWRVLMAYTSDNSQVCTCEHSSGNFVFCSSMITY